MLILFNLSHNEWNGADVACCFQSVENSICILRNLSYRLENEIDRERYADAPTTELNRKEPEKPDPGCMAGCGTGSKKKKKRTIKEPEQPQIRREPVEGVALLWQPEIVKSYLSIMAEASNPETLEGSAGAIHNLTACGWRVSSTDFFFCFPAQRYICQTECENHCIVVVVVVVFCNTVEFQYFFPENASLGRVIFHEHQML